MHVSVTATWESFHLLLLPTFLGCQYLIILFATPLASWELVATAGTEGKAHRLWLGSLESTLSPSPRELCDHGQVLRPF